MRGYSTVTRSLTSWNASRSPVQISTSKSACSASVARVAITSSASNPSTPRCGTFSASRTSLTRSTCPLNSSGLADRLALYSTYSSERNVLRDTSNATAEVRRRLVPQHVDEHRGEPEHAVGVLPGLGGEVLHRQREERPVRHRVAVDQQQLRTLRRRRHRSSSLLRSRHGRDSIRAETDTRSQGDQPQIPRNHEHVRHPPGPWTPARCAQTEGRGGRRRSRQGVVGVPSGAEPAKQSEVGRT